MSGPGLTGKGSINYVFDRFNSKPSGDIGVYTFRGELRAEHHDELALVLMRAIHGMDYTIINLSGVTSMDKVCCRLIKEVYEISRRFNKSLMVTGIGVSVIKDPSVRKMLLSRKKNTASYQFRKSSQPISVGITS